MATTLYDPRDERCKSPYGAVAGGTPVRFRLWPGDGDAITRCELVYCREFADVWADMEMPAGEEDGRRFFAGTLEAPPPDLVWYHFRLTWADGGVCCYGKEGFSAWDTVKSWQLTVYDGTTRTPDWFGRGVSYQIFPERFYRAKRREVTGMVGERTLHENWDEMMEYLPNAQGEITCSDFFGGDLGGIAEKLDYLASLGVTTLYLNPIFEAASNHRYDTADYMKIDPLLGEEADFRALCERAKESGIRVVLDGVFNHTGSNSVYFNAKGFYPTPGAAQSLDSPYAKWYHFTRFPDKYDAWWGFKTLPQTEEMEPDFMRFIITGEDSVVRHWLRAGASGWRLDVADELPDEFIAEIRRVMEEENPEAYLIGEVWEDGSNKVAYSRRRKYLLGHETHALMNYPFRDALLSYLLHGSAEEFRESMETLRENYPPAAYYGAMNFLSTHDTPRLLTVLGYTGRWPTTREERARIVLQPHEERRGRALLRLGALIMFSFPGSPTVYYGDEAGMQGFEDPFNRGTYPWGREDQALIAWFARLGALRNTRESLQSGNIRYLAAEKTLLAFERAAGKERSLVVSNAADARRELTLPWDGAEAQDALTARRFPTENGALRLTLEPYEGLLLTEVL